MRTLTLFRDQSCLVESPRPSERKGLSQWLVPLTQLATRLAMVIFRLRSCVSYPIDERRVILKRARSCNSSSSSGSNAVKSGYGGWFGWPLLLPALPIKIDDKAHWCRLDQRRLQHRSLTLWPASLSCRNHWLSTRVSGQHLYLSRPRVAFSLNSSQQQY